jgi:energy-coupling factor transporter transmembrane protein EcfT
MFLQSFLEIIDILRARYMRGHYWLKVPRPGALQSLKFMLFAMCSSKLR